MPTLRTGGHLPHKLISADGHECAGDSGEAVQSAVDIEVNAHAAFDTQTRIVYHEVINSISNQIWKYGYFQQATGLVARLVTGHHLRTRRQYIHHAGKGG